MQDGLTYLDQNPDVTPEVFVNQFMGESEEEDFLYDSDYWEDPNLTFPQQALPSWSDYNAAYPRNPNGTYMTGADNIFNHVGGDVLQARLTYPGGTNNPCALKQSIALNYSGVVIPQITTSNGYPGTLQGADGKYYFLNAKSMNKWMKETFGTNPATATTPFNSSHYQFTSVDGGTNGENFPTLLAGKKGIFTMLPISEGAFGASGHCDKFDGTECAAKCYFPHASEVNIWVLE